MKALKLLKKNSFASLILLAYAILFTIRPDMGVSAIKNSGYYIKEMLIIMPVIFVLTALLDSWVPKHTIMKYLGKESRIKGLVLSFVLGAISAGPIYAAFPLCVMLHKKGASIRNLVIILSSWAVIKIPMLINEVKFLGMEFMAVRWALTVIAIIIFSWITSKIVKDTDLPSENERPAKKGVTVNQNACMGCSICAKTYPELFEMQHKKAGVKEIDAVLNMDKLKTAINDCPVKAIKFHDEK